MAGQDSAEPAVAAVDSPEAPAPADHPTDGGNGPDVTAEASESGRGRAAGYRQRAQEAETARDTALERVGQLEAVVAQFQRSAVEAAAGAAGLRPAALWAVADLDSLIGDDGQPNREAIGAAVEKARAELGVERPTVRRQLGMRSGATAPQPPRADPWAAAFAPADR